MNASSSHIAGRKVAFVAPPRIEFAHSLRGLAALSVVISHFMNVFWSSPDAIGGLLKVPPLQVSMPGYFAPLHFGYGFDYGSFGVALFFLISGFVIPFSLAGLSACGFLIARVLRIYPVYFVALGISLAALTCVRFFYADDQAFPYSFGHVVSQALLVRGWLWIPSIDGLSWTLEVEIFFYVIAAVLVPNLSIKTAAVILMGCFTIVPAVSIAIFNNFDIFSPAYAAMARYLTFSLPFIVYMFIGTLFYCRLRGQVSHVQFLLCLCVGALGFQFVSVTAFIRDTTSYFLALLIFSGCFFARSRIGPNRVLSALADISYPLYAVHAMMGYSMMYALVSNGSAPIVAAIVAVCASLAVATVLHFLVEVPSSTGGKQLAIKWFPKVQP